MRDRVAAAERSIRDREDAADAGIAGRELAMAGSEAELQAEWGKLRAAVAAVDGEKQRVLAEGDLLLHEQAESAEARRQFEQDKHDYMAENLHQFSLRRSQHSQTAPPPETQDAAVDPKDQVNAILHYDSQLLEGDLFDGDDEREVESSRREAAVSGREEGVREREAELMALTEYVAAQRRVVDEQTAALVDRAVMLERAAEIRGGGGDGGGPFSLGREPPSPVAAASDVAVHPLLAAAGRPSRAPPSAPLPPSLSQQQPASYDWVTPNLM